MLRKTSRWLAVFLLCGVGQAVSTLADDLPKTGETRDTLLYVRTDPPGAKVILDNKELGTSSGLFQVEPGTVTIVVKLDGHEQREMQVTIRANGVTRVVLELKPQAKAEGDHVIGRPPQGMVEPVSYTVGVNYFRSGDSITITEVKATSPDLKMGDKAIVKGYYTLASEPKASLCLFATATEGSGTSPIRPGQTIGITKGEGKFELFETFDCKGYLHVTFYSVPTGKPFGGSYFGTAKQMEEIKHWNVRSRYTASEPDRSGVDEIRTGQKTTASLGSEQATKPLTEAEGAHFTTFLSQGTVELVGITDYPPTSHSQWWKPDGSAVQLDLGALLPEPTQWSTPVEKTVTFLLRFQNLPADASRPACDVEPCTNRWWGTTGVLDVHGTTVPNYNMFSAELGASAVTASLRVGISMGAWDTVITQKPDSAGTSSFSRYGRQWAVTFQKATAGAFGDSTEVALTPNGEFYGKWNTRLIAVDSDGNEHTPSAYGFKQRNGHAGFRGLPLSSVKEFRFQVRPFEWVEFKNVAIQSGQKTDAKVISLDAPTSN